MRAAAFRTLKRTLVSNQTIEPTQVAGFNQFFDDTESTEAWRYGLGVDFKLSPKLFAGTEFSSRDLESPALVVFPVPEVIGQEFDEWAGRAYMHWILHRLLVFTAEHHYEKFERDISFPGPADFTELTTHRTLLQARFSHRSGVTAALKATYFDQKGEFGNIFGSIVPGDDRFWVVDASIGFRLPKRFGLLTFMARNIADEQFNYQDIDPASPLILPERLISLRLSLFF